MLLSYYTVRFVGTIPQIQKELLCDDMLKPNLSLCAGLMNRLRMAFTAVGATNLILLFFFL